MAWSSVPIPAIPTARISAGVDQNLPGRQLSLIVEAQIVALETLAAQAGVALRYVKPHGALYNQAQRDYDVATYMLYPVFKRTLPILGQPKSMVERMAGELNLPFIAEGFADRRYQPDGRLVPRSEPNAMLHDPVEIKAQVLGLVDREFRTICIHGDDPRSVDLADLVLDTLKGAGVEVRSFV